MKIAVVGATGKAGSRIVTEALARGHTVTGICRNPDSLPAHAKLTKVKGDTNDPDSLAKLAAGHDALVLSVRFLNNNPDKLLALAKKSTAKRFIVVGGASSLLTADNKVLLETPGFPDVAKPEATAGRKYFEMLKRETGVNWTYMSPSAMFAPGQRTGKFRVGKDHLLVAADGKSHVSMEDFAIALVDELEKPKHTGGQRFTVGY
jgi:putative NADH-flavin reductase